MLITLDSVDRILYKEGERFCVVGKALTSSKCLT